MAEANRQQRETEARIAALFGLDASQLRSELGFDLGLWVEVSAHAHVYTFIIDRHGDIVDIKTEETH